MLKFNDDLLGWVTTSSYVIVVGYDNVGKGLVLDSLKEFLDDKYGEDIPVFHPDYSITGKHTPPEGRWTYFMYLIDYLQKMKKTFSTRIPCLIDRCALCGAVYNIDGGIAKEYADRVKGMNLIHILVETDEDSFYGFQDVRGSDQKFTYDDYKFFTRLYEEFLRKYDLPYYIYENHYDKDFATKSLNKCATCGHWKTDRCVNPNGNPAATKDSPRCSHANEKEVQDLET